MCLNVKRKTGEQQTVSWVSSPQQFHVNFKPSHCEIHIHQCNLTWDTGDGAEKNYQTSSTKQKFLTMWGGKSKLKSLQNILIG